MLNRSLFGVLVVMAAAIVSGCDTMQLLAPTNSTVTVTSPTTVLPTGGSTEVTAVVLESAGTPVQNGTTVRFTTNLGRVEPEEVQTRNGMAVVTFHAGDASGTATIRARSGSAGGASTGAGAGEAPAATPSSSVTIVVGAAAVASVGVQANPSFVSANGGSVAVVATVLGTGGRALAGVPVTFSTTAGSLSPTQAITDANGQATSRLTTTAAATVTASAGPAVTGTAAVTVLPAPALTISCAVGATTNCLNVVAGQPVALTISRATGTSVIQSATLNFGDGSPSVDLGSLAASVTVPHVYSQPGSYTVRVTATDVNGESVTVTHFIQVFAPATGTVSAEVVSGRTVRATASISGGTVLSYAWTFDTGISFTTSSGEATYTYPPIAIATTKTITVTATLADGRTITAVTTVTLVP